jgi:hypothetical protein
MISLANLFDGPVVLNAECFDKELLGEQLPSPNTCRRLYQPTGLLRNDNRGCERGRPGTSKTATGQCRCLLGLHDACGVALQLLTPEDEYKALCIAGSGAICW